jgi:predicted nucleic-acid-binding Zn-ribbon protein
MEENEEPKQRKRREIAGSVNATFEQFDKYTEAFGLEKECPDCGASHWRSFGLDLEDGTAATRFVMTGDIGGALAVYVLICGNCAHTKFYEASGVDRWIRENA